MKSTISLLKLFLILILLSYTSSSRAADYYWVGGTGSWSDFANHWATSSGGTVFQPSIPDSTDNVFFDTNSLQAGDTIFIGNGNNFCKNFYMNTGNGSIYFRIEAGSTPDPMIINGNIEIHDSTFWYDTNLSDFVQIDLFGSSPTLYAPYSKLFAFRLMGQGTINMQSDLDIAGDLNFNSTQPITFITNNFDLIAASLTNYGGVGPYFVSLGTSTVALLTYIDIETDADSAHIIFNSIASIYLPLHIHKLTIDIYGDLDGSVTNPGLKVDEMIVNGFYRNKSNSSDTIHKLVVFNSLSIDGRIVVDSLILANPFQSVGFNAIEVNDYITTVSTPGNPIFFVGLPGELTVYTDTVCLDFLDMSDVTCLGTAIYFAGNYSNDGGGNTGWQFSSCTPLVSSVWPGDIDYDLGVDHLDLLMLGLAVGNSGTTRDSVSTLFIAHNSIDWPTFLVNPVNMKHADCDGSGIIDTNDIYAIVTNYGLVHPAFVNPSAINFPLSGIGAPLYFDFPAGSAVAGNSYSVPIGYGQQGSAGQPLYGIAFSVVYDTNQVDPSSVYISYPSNWLASSGDAISIQHNFPAQGIIDAAITRYDLGNSVGNGEIAIIHFTLKTNASGNFNLSFLQPLALLNNQSEIILQPQPMSPVPVTVGLTEQTAIQFTLSPNPAQDYVRISGIPSNLNYSLRIYDNVGRIIETKQIPSGNSMHEINISTLSSGIYTIEISNPDFKSVKKLIIE